MTTAPAAPFRRGGLVLLTIAIVFSAASVRAPIVAVAPVARTIAHDLQVGAGVVGLLTTIPVLLFAVVTPLAVWVSRRFGPEFTLTLCLAGVVVACLVRSAGGLGAALVGTALLGLFITFGNVVIPVVISHEYPPARVPTMTSVYTASINVGTMTVTIATAPLQPHLGWQGAIAVWGAFALVALAVWAATHGVRAAMLPGHPAFTAPIATADNLPRPVLRTPVTWLLAAAFGAQSFAYYGMSAWLPTLLVDHGYAVTVSGAISAVFQVFGIAGALLSPVAARRGGVTMAVLLCAACWVVVVVGFLVNPDLWWLWCAVGGLGQGAGITLVIVMIVGFGGGRSMVASRSGAVQGIGYVVGAVGPTVVGGVHDATGAWTLPLVVVLVVVLGFAAAAASAARRLPARS
ncbi:MFS transporter [Pseudolysinimonas sp.]|uniref:MFS transporter n=1 Tax=Pseudolysinimonas sp. TaxID=2680009 RepID=UPI003F814B51